MANAILATPALSDAGLLTAGSEETTLPGINLQNAQPSKKWRTTSLSNIYVEIDLTAAKEINLVALIGHNGSSTGTWRVRAATSQANLTAAPGYDSGSVSLFATTKPTGWTELPTILWLGSSTQTYRWWRFDVTDASNTDGYFQAGRLYVSFAWQPTVNIQYNGAIAWIDPSPVGQSVGGQMYPTPRALRRVIEFSFDFLDEDEMMNNAFEIDRLRGSSGDVLFIRDPAATTHLHRNTIYGLIRDLQPIINTTFGVFTKPFRIEEMI